MRRLAVLAIAGFVVAVVAYDVAVWLSFRMLGNPDELSPAHRRLLDRVGDWDEDVLAYAKRPLVYGLR